MSKTKRQTKFHTKKLFINILSEMFPSVEFVITFKSEQLRASWIDGPGMEQMQVIGRRFWRGRIEPATKMVAPPMTRPIFDRTSEVAQFDSILCTRRLGAISRSKSEADFRAATGKNYPDSASHSIRSQYQKFIQHLCHTAYLEPLFSPTWEKLEDIPVEMSFYEFFAAHEADSLAEFIPARPALRSSARL